MLKEYLIQIAVCFMAIPFVVSALFLVFGIVKARRAKKSGKRVDEKSILETLVDIERQEQKLKSDEKP